MRGRQTFLLCLVGAIGVAAVLAVLAVRRGSGSSVPSVSKEQIQAAEKAGVA